MPKPGPERDSDGDVPWIIHTYRGVGEHRCELLRGVYGRVGAVVVLLPTKRMIGKPHRRPISGHMSLLRSCLCLTPVL